MPELPEVETIRRGLSRYLPGKTVVRETHDNAKSFPNAEAQVNKFLLGAEVVTVERRAKVLIIELSTKYSLLIHLKMTGQLVFVGRADSKSQKERFGGGHPSDSLIAELPDKSTRVTIEFADGSKLFFNDQRKFGWMRLIPTAEVPQIDFFKRIGPEPLGPDFTYEYFKDAIKRRSRTSIKAAILDQAIVAGVGNIYADESLFAARIHPAAKVSDISAAKLKRLHSAIKDVLELSIKSGGSTDRNYVDAQGRKGNYLKFAKVFRRQGQPCSECGGIIEKTKVAGRGTHYCPKCQRLP